LKLSDGGPKLAEGTSANFEELLVRLAGRPRRIAVWLIQTDGEQRISDTGLWKRFREPRRLSTTLSGWHGLPLPVAGLLNSLAGDVSVVSDTLLTFPGLVMMAVACTLFMLTNLKSLQGRRKVKLTVAEINV